MGETEGGDFDGRTKPGTKKLKKIEQNLTRINETKEGCWKVTKIESAKRNPNRCNIFINSKYQFSLTLAQVVELKLKVGKELNETELSQCEEAGREGKLFQQTLEWALTRPRSIAETRDYLEKKRRMRELAAKRELKRKVGEPFSAKMGERVLTKLVEKGYVDDTRFANWFAENREARKGTSRRKLKMEMRRKGVAESLIEQALNQSGRDEKAEIEKIIAKKGAKMDKIKLSQYLMRRGFDLELVRATLDERD